MTVLEKPSVQYAETLDEIVRRGLPLYTEMRSRILTKHRGEYVVINIDNGDAVFGRTELEASEAFDKKYGIRVAGFLQLVE